MEYKLGVVAGMLAGLAVGFLVIHILKRRTIIDFTFDERQMLARGKAYTWAFFTLAVMTLVEAVYTELVGRWCDSLFGAFLCIGVSVVVFAGTCIRNDAYMSLKEKPRTVMLTFGIIALFNLLVSLSPIHEGLIFQNGVVTFRAINLACAALLAVIMVIYATNRMLTREDE